MQIGSPEELQSAPATPFVLHFIDDVNQMPANCQFVKRMGYRTEKPYVMCRPSVFDVSLVSLSTPTSTDACEMPAIVLSALLPWLHQE